MTLPNSLLSKSIIGGLGGCDVADLTVGKLSHDAAAKTKAALYADPLKTLFILNKGKPLDGVTVQLIFPSSFTF